MTRGNGGLKEPALHLILVAVALAVVFLPGGHGGKAAPTRGAGHHGGRCHACSFALSPEQARERDAALARAGCIELAADSE